MSAVPLATVPMRVEGTVHAERPGWASPPGGTGVTETYLAASRVSVLHGLAEGDVYRNGQNSWSPTGWRGLAQAPLRVADPRRRQTADDTGWDDPLRHHSSWLISVTDGSAAYLLGCLEGDTPRLHADRDVLAAWTETGRPATWVLLSGAEDAVFTRYRDLLADRYGVLDQDPGTVWSSWYSLYETVSRADLDKIVPQLPELGFDTVQIDDGWEQMVGDWTPNEKFAAGMKDAAAMITDHGMRPGLWVAPFIALPGSRVVRRNPQMLLRDADGAPVRAGSNWGSHYHTFDFTRPDAREMLVETVSRVVHDWGFTYLKLDFVNAGAVAGVRAEDVDREAAYRSAIQAVRDAVGPDVYLLGSGAPVFPSLGVLNAVRTGPDVAPMWDNYASDDPSDAMARNAVFNGVNRLWLRGLIGIDPDVVYFRRRRNLLSDEQMGWLRDCALLSAFRAVSDPPEWIEPADLPALREFLAGAPATERVGRYRYRIGSRLVDFAPAIDGGSAPYPI
ncbi:glycoside hydrolase family 36 protein [Promicromonospora sp. NPDC052451]|uniref:glycoside hydrolase family 36 protein n=1 Tax=Promicromonospora sp. NPDC052451 TaxID=3364407 RepID=UPI0037CC9033